MSGSLKRASTNGALLRAAAALAPNSMQFTFYDQQIGELPHFRPELDEEGALPPPQVAEFRRLLAESDAVLISCPEYGHGVPGSFKNAIDWTISSGEFARKPVALLMASPSGAEHAWAALAATLRVIEADLVFEASIVLARRHFDDNGGIVDAAIEAEVRKAIEALRSRIAGA
jgi:NAD(P)H-dependent FMN reductase